MKNKQLIALLILGGLGFYYYMNRRPIYAPQFRNVPYPPPANSPNYQIWIDGILKAFGQVTALWQPGGPFYNQPGVPPPPTEPASPTNPNPGGLY